MDERSMAVVFCRGCRHSRLGARVQRMADEKDGSVDSADLLCGRA